MFSRVKKERIRNVIKKRKREPTWKLALYLTIFAWLVAVILHKTRFFCLLRFWFPLVFFLMLLKICVHTQYIFVHLTSCVTCCDFLCFLLLENLTTSLLFFLLLSHIVGENEDIFTLSQSMKMMMMNLKSWKRIFYELFATIWIIGPPIPLTLFPLSTNEELMGI